MGYGKAFSQTPYFLIVFLATAVVVFLGYTSSLLHDVVLIFIGPVLYMAHVVNSTLASNLEIKLSYSGALFQFGILLPVTLGYYGVIAFQLESLKSQERGFLRFAGTIGLTIFVIYIHFLAWQHLMGYFDLPSAENLSKY